MVRCLSVPLDRSEPVCLCLGDNLGWRNTCSCRSRDPAEDSFRHPAHATRAVQANIVVVVDGPVWAVAEDTRLSDRMGVGRAAEQPFAKLFGHCFPLFSRRDGGPCCSPPRHFHAREIARFRPSYLIISARKLISRAGSAKYFGNAGHPKSDGQNLYSKVVVMNSSNALH